VSASTPQGRVARSQLLPRMGIAGQNDDEGGEGRKLRTTLAFLVGIRGGPWGEGMPRDVFRLELDLLMPSWDPLRRGIIVAGPPVQG